MLERKNGLPPRVARVPALRLNNQGKKPNIPEPPVPLRQVASWIPYESESKLSHRDPKSKEKHDFD